jgi:hypothetical protein
VADRDVTEMGPRAWTTLRSRLIEAGWLTWDEQVEKILDATERDIRADQTRRIVEALEAHYRENTVCGDFRQAIDIAREFGGDDGFSKE